MSKLIYRKRWTQY